VHSLKVAFRYLLYSNATKEQMNECRYCAIPVQGFAIFVSLHLISYTK